MTQGLGATHWPVEIRLKRAEKILVVAFDNGVTFNLPAEAKFVAEA